MIVAIRPENVLLFVALCGQVCAQEAKPATPPAKDGAAERSVDDPESNVLNPEEWHRVDAAVKRALTWLAAQQQPDGSFPTLTNGQPGVTMSRQQVQAITNLVSSSVAGMSAADVSVADSTGRVLSSSGGSGALTSRL